MAVNEFELDDVFDELNRKFANVSLDQSSMGYYKEITRDDVRIKQHLLTRKKSNILGFT